MSDLWGDDYNDWPDEDDDDDPYGSKFELPGQKKPNEDYPRQIEVYHRMRRNLYGECIDLLNELIKDNPNNEFVYLDLAKTWYWHPNKELGFPKAKEAIANALLRGSSFATLLMAAEIFAVDGQWDYGRQLLFQAEATSNEDWSSVWFFRAGFTCSVLNENKKGLGYFLKCTDFDPYWAEAWFNCGILSQRQKKYADAIRYYEYATFSNPGYAAAYVQMGSCYFSQKRFKEALENYEHADFLNPDDEVIQKQLTKLQKIVNDRKD